MSLRELDRWILKNDLSDYLDQVRIVRPEDLRRADAPQEMLNIRLPRWLKEDLGREAKSKGLRGASSLLRVLAIEHLGNARSKAA